MTTTSSGQSVQHCYCWPVAGGWLVGWTAAAAGQRGCSNVHSSVKPQPPLLATAVQGIDGGDVDLPTVLESNWITGFFSKVRYGLFKGWVALSRACCRAPWLGMPVGSLMAGHAHLLLLPRALLRLPSFPLPPPAPLQLFLTFIHLPIYAVRPLVVRPKAVSESE